MFYAIERQAIRRRLPPQCRQRRLSKRGPAQGRGPQLDGRANLPGASRSTVRMQGSLLLVDGKPFAVRAIEWNGEPFEFLAERGFNVVELHSVPTPEQLADAQRANVWLTCPPPAVGVAFSTEDRAAERVLVWRLADADAPNDAAYFRNWIQTLRSQRFAGAAGGDCRRNAIGAASVRLRMC